MYKFLCGHVFIFFGTLLRVGRPSHLAALCLTEEPPAVLRSRRVTLPSHQPWRGLTVSMPSPTSAISFPPSLLPLFLPFCFSSIVILVAVRLYLGDLIYIFPIANDAKHLFMFLLGICISSHNLMFISIINFIIFFMLCMQ